MHLRVLIDGKVCRLSERTRRRWVCPNAPGLAARLSKEFSPWPYDPAFEYREVMRIIGELTGRFGDRLSIKSINVNEAYASAAQLETVNRLCGTDGVRRSEIPERPDCYLLPFKVRLHDRGSGQRRRQLGSSVDQETVT